MAERKINAPPEKIRIPDLIIFGCAVRIVCIVQVYFLNVALRHCDDRERREREEKEEKSREKEQKEQKEQKERSEIMELTLAEMRVLSEALTFAIDIRMKEFDRNKDRCEVTSMQHAVQAARDIKRFDKMRAIMQLQINKEMRTCG